MKKSDQVTLKRKFWGANGALAIGILMFAGSVTNPQGGGGLIGGPVLVIGSLAYRSAKRTALGLVPQSALRQVVELLGITAVIAIVGLQRDVLGLMYSDPVPNLIIPLSVLIAYVVARTGRVEQAIVPPSDSPSA